MDWFLYDNGLGHERVKKLLVVSREHIFSYVKHSAFSYVKHLFEKAYGEESL